MKETILKYVEGIGAKQPVIDWLEQRVFCSKTINQGEVEHIIDYLISDKAPKNLTRATYDQMKTNADKWTKALAKKGKNITEIEGKDYEVILDFKDGFKITKLLSKKAYEREGNLMTHCVSSYYGKDDTIYSLRDKNNLPHATMSQSSQQIKGKGNETIHPNYIKYVVKFLEHLKIEVRDSEMLNLGYINIKDLKKYLNKETKEGLFKGEYWYKQNKLYDKNNNEFACFELLDKIPLVEETKKSVKVNFELPMFLKTSTEFLFQKVKNKGNDKNYAQIGSSGDLAKIGSSGNGAKIGSSGNYAQIGSSGDLAQIGSSGNYAQIGSSGYGAQIGSSGNGAKIGSSGNYAQIGSSGDRAQIGSSGYGAQIGSSGNYAQIGSSGDLAKIGSSGYGAKIGSSGNYAQIGSSGNGAKIEVEGENTVCAAIGYNSRIKATKGTWITLAEYDKDGKPIFVKSAQIDGKKLKENVWYQLKNKKIVEVKE